MVVELGHAGDCAGVVAADGVEAAGHGGYELPVVADALHGHAAGQVGVGAPGGAEVLGVEAEAGAEAGEGYVHRLAEHAGLDQLEHLLIRRAVVVREADHYLAVVLLRHLLELHGVLDGDAHGLFKVEGDVVLEHHLHVVEALRGRGGDHGVVRLRAEGFDLVVADGGAAKLVGDYFGVGLAYVEAAVDAAAQADDRTAVVACDVAAADEEYFHVNVLLAPRHIARTVSTMFSAVMPFMASRRSYGAL